jgi:hypothetical protein
METEDFKKMKHLLSDHELKDDVRFNSIDEKLYKIMDMIKPIHDLYTGSRFTFMTITGVLKFLALIGAAVGSIIYIIKLKWL